MKFSRKIPLDWLILYQNRTEARPKYILNEILDLERWRVFNETGKK